MVNERPKLNPRLLRVYRKALGLTQKEVADAVGVNLNGYQRWEYGERNPTDENLVALAEKLKKTPAELCINFSEALQEEAMLTVIEIKGILATFKGDEEYYDKLFHYHEALLKTLKAGGILHKVIPNPFIADRDRLDNSIPTPKEIDPDDAAAEFINGDHDNDLDEDTPNSANINPYEEDDDDE